MSLVILKELLKLVRILKKGSCFDALGITRVAHKSKQVLKNHSLAISIDTMGAKVPENFLSPVHFV